MNSSHSLLKRFHRLIFREPRTPTELIVVLKQAQKRELIDRDALQMIEGVLAVSEKKVRDVMIPKAQMVVLDGDAKAVDVLPVVTQSQHSRFPVCIENAEKLLGVLLAKDLLLCAFDNTHQTRMVRDLIRPAILIPESKRLDVLLKEFRQSHQHMAIVVDEYGAVAGLVTIEDVLEEIVGDIRDEYDSDEGESLIKPVGNAYLVSALTPVQDFNHYFHTHWGDTDFDTIGGLVVQKFSYLPKRHEKIMIPPFEVTVVKATRRGILTLQFKKVAEE